ncbi:MAG: DEAD/DEAH box helicase [Deltaproteobacteria bacterium]|nr:DEAD/DEAH box helicase [Deltaproteobacteria bacterium]
MRIDTLEAFGIDDRIIELWKATGHQELLPIQQIAVRKGKVLDGKSAVIFSPTSSGKTFVGEMAAVQTARQNRRAIYLVPQKALAEEKYQEFTRKYASFGIRVVISSRDRQEFDQDIYKGRFHVAVVVFEKMQALMVASPAMLRNVGLVVVDELQMIGDKTRGAGLEILLTKILLAQDKPQIIGLSAVLGNAKQLADWMGAELCEDHRRPVELRKGVLQDGTFHYVEHNSGKEGKEELNGTDGGEDRSHTLVSQVRSLAEKGEQCLVFCKSKTECVELARVIAEGIKCKPADQTLDELHFLEDSLGKDHLSEMLSRGVAYHNADLDWEQREIIERWFRQGEIKVVCATSTLAVGINLPARNVFIDPERWDRDKTGRWVTIPISQAEYENTSGRAGRLGLEESFGRAMIIGRSEFERRMYLNAFVNGELEDIQPALGTVPLAQHVLNLVASMICREDREIGEVLRSSYTGSLCWRSGVEAETFDERLKKSIGQCIEGGLIERRESELVPTKIGKLVAAKGVSVGTAIAMVRFLDEKKDVATDLDPLEVLWCLTGTVCGQEIHFNLSKNEFWSRRYQEMLNETVAQIPKSVRHRLEGQFDGVVSEYEGIQRIKKMLLLHSWTMGVPTRRIEKNFLCFAGGVSGLSVEYAWLAETLAAFAKVKDWPKDVVENLYALSRQLIFGVPVEGVKLASTRVKGLGRARIAALIKADLNELEKVLSEPIENLGKILTRPVADRLHKRAEELLQMEKAAKEEKLISATDDFTGEPTEAPEFPEWEEAYPPSDPLGVSYILDVRIHLDGRPKKRRHLVTIDGKEVWLTERSFGAALRLGLAAKNTSLGWLDCDQLGSIDNYHQVIRRLKKALKIADIDADRLIENNGAKQYRFSVPPGNVSLDEMVIREHVTGGEKIIIPSPNYHSMQ